MSYPTLHFLNFLGSESLSCLTYFPRLLPFVKHSLDFTGVFLFAFVFPKHSLCTEVCLYLKS